MTDKSIPSTRRSAPTVPALPWPSAGVLPPVDPTGNHPGAGRGRRLPHTTRDKTVECPEDEPETTVATLKQPRQPVDGLFGTFLPSRPALTDYGRHTLALRLTSLAELLIAERIPASGDAELDDEVRAIKQDIVRGLLERAAELSA